jgi:predicted ArsR family transcriptional regulator
MGSGWDRRFFATTRGQVVELLRRGHRTVEELAQALQLTDNAVRAHLSALERDGLVRQGGLQRGHRRPSYAYELTPEADRLFPKPYGAVLAELIGVLREQLSKHELEAAVRVVGQRLGAGYPPAVGPPSERIEYALIVLAELGGLAEREDGQGVVRIIGFSCPLALAAVDHPEICQLAASLLSEITDLPVTEQCDRATGPRCMFAVEVGA